jgi:hypothetical protein
MRRWAPDNRSSRRSSVDRCLRRHGPRLTGKASSAPVPNPHLQFHPWRSTATSAKSALLSRCCNLESARRVAGSKRRGLRLAGRAPPPSKATTTNRSRDERGPGAGLLLANCTVGWVELCEAHRHSARWASLRSTHPTSFPSLTTPEGRFKPQASRLTPQASRQKPLSGSPTRQRGTGTSREHRPR